MHTFEVYQLADDLTSNQWATLCDTILNYGGIFTKFDLIFVCNGNIVRFFIKSNKDLSSLANRIEGMLLRPVAELPTLPKAKRKEWWVHFVTTGNILDVREKYAVKRNKELGYAVFKVRRFAPGRTAINVQLNFKDLAGTWSRVNKPILNFSRLPAQLLAISFEENIRYLRRTVNAYLDIEKSLHMVSSNKTNALFAVDMFPYFTRSYFLGLRNYDFDKHSLIIGATGTGKSKLITLLIDRLHRTSMRMNYRVVIIDPHDALADGMDSIEDKKVIKFNNDGTELFSNATTDISAATELTSALFKSLLADQFNARLQRVLRFSVYALLTAQTMSLDMLKRFLSEIELRTEILDHVTGFAPDNVVKFFATDFNEIRTKQYNEAILPIISLVDELQMQPGLSASGDNSLERTIEDNFLTVFSLNKVSMGEKATKTIAGLLIQQIFLLAQSYAFNQRVLLVIDEVSVVQNPTIASILAEARKFNLAVILTQQYFGQIDRDLQAAIFSNVYNYYVFKTSEEDARALEGNLNMRLPRELVEAEKKKGISEAEIRVRMITQLHPRECLVRLSSNGRLNPCLKARTATVKDVDPGKRRQLRPYNPNLPDRFVESARPTPLEQPANEEQQPAPQVIEASPRPNIPLSEILSMQSAGRKQAQEKKETE